MSFKNLIHLTRLNQPVGIILLFLPCLFGIILSFKQIDHPSPHEILFDTFIFTFGSIIMRSAGCIINDIFDKDFDKKIERTKNRPIASGKISKHKALLFLINLLAIAFALLLQLKIEAILSGFIALALVTAYPLMKRITHYPQIFLGLTFNFGIIMTSLHILGKIGWDIAILYLFAIIWTLIYDTIYAYQDIEDDLKVGVKSSAIKFSKNPKKILTNLNLLSFALLIFLGWKEEFSADFFITILLADLYLNLKIQKCDLTIPTQCLKTFKSNIVYGAIIALALILA